MSTLKDATSTIKEQVSGSAIKTFLLTYGLAFVLALSAIGLALTNRDEKTGKFGLTSYAIGLMTPSLFLVLTKWLRGMKIDVEALGSFHRALSGATILVAVLMYSFDQILGPVLANEAASSKSGETGIFTTIMFAIPKLVQKDKAQAAISSLTGYTPAGGGSPSGGANAAANAAAGGAPSGAATAGQAPASQGGGLADDMQKLIDNAFADVAPAGVGAYTEDFFLSLQAK